MSKNSMRKMYLKKEMSKELLGEYSKQLLYYWRKTGLSEKRVNELGLYKYFESREEIDILSLSPEQLQNMRVLLDEIGV